MKLYKLIMLVIIFGITLNAKSLRIEAKELSIHLKDYTILDTRSNTLYMEGHIKGALNFPINLTYENDKINGKLTNPIKIQKIIRKLGLDIDSKIVVYDDGTFFDAARLFWSLEVYGFTNIKLLNTGYNEWLFDNYSTSVKLPYIVPSKYIVKINNKRLATKFTTQIATANPNQVIIDARAYKAYIGEISVAKRFGHIPKAIHIPATHNINYGTNSIKLKTITKLKNIYKDINKNKKVIIYCAIGKISSTNYFALRELGYDVSNYDSSWKEWGNDFNLPIINKTRN